jgi:uncharacterized protein (UPF0332 family)
MKPETADYLSKTRSTLVDATKIVNFPLPHIAAREAYLAVFHAAEAYIFEHTGKAAKTHRGLRGEFSRLARNDETVGRDLITFLGTAYQFETVADYSIGSAVTPISTAAATAAINTAERFIDAISRAVSSDD